MSSLTLLLPLIVLIVVATLSLVWHDQAFTLTKLANINFLSFHVFIVLSLFAGYFYVINKARKIIIALMKEQEQSNEMLSALKKQLHLETYQHQKTNVELHALKTQDPLTKLYNHAYFMDRLTHEVERTRRYGSEFSLLIIELDHFNEINDRFGNKFGDFAIKKHAQLIERRLRKSDLLTRYDGHHFAIIAPNTDLQASTLFANRLCNDIEISKVLFEGVPLDITLSIGIGIPSAVDELSCDSLTTFTEQTLRTAIKQGGNQVVSEQAC